jgi:DNA-directed RNA polymerase specialized sigma24 family protein
MSTPEEERFARLLARLSPEQRAAYLKKQAEAARLQEIVDAIESDDDESEAEDSGLK